MFGQTLPAFNIKGKSVVNTISGGIMTVMIFSVMLSYAAIKLVILTGRHNPNVSQFTEKNFYDQDEKMNLS